MPLNASEKERVESADYHIALTLLPRVLSLIYPTLPIVLFSSTGRKEIAEHLRPYGNIILEFAKPQLSGSLSSDFVSETRRRFERATRRALAMARARERFQIVERCVASSGRILAASMPQTKSGGAIIEIFLDESKSDKFAVGGIVVSYPDEQSVVLLDEALKDAGLVWGLAEGHDPRDPNGEIPAQYLPKEHRDPVDYEDDLKRILATADRACPEVEFAAVGLVRHSTFPEQQHGSTAILLRQDSLDNCYRAMLEDLISNILFDWLPHYCPNASSVRIDVATRIARAKSATELTHLGHNFGVESLRFKPQMFYSLGASDVYPIVARCLSRTGGHNAPPPVDRARGVTLFDYSDLQELRQRRPDLYRNRILTTPRPRQLHFLADWISRFASSQYFRQRIPTCKVLFQNGFLQASNDAWRHFSNGTAQARNDHVVDAIVETSRALRLEGEELDRGALWRWQMQTVARSIQNFTGHDFLDLVDRVVAK